MVVFGKKWHCAQRIPWGHESCAVLCACSMHDAVLVSSACCGGPGVQLQTGTVHQLDTPVMLLGSPTPAAADVVL